MPELPEAEAARSLMRQYCRHKLISKAIVAEDTKVVEGSTPQELQNVLTGKTISDIGRKGKYMWFELTPPNTWVMMHFGMTGAVIIKGVKAIQYKSSKIGDEALWPPKHCKLELHFEDGTELAFTDPRRFGRLKLLPGPPLTSSPISELGFDALDELPDPAAFHALLKGRCRKSSTLRIKALLLDQAFSAGVGNWVADEVLYQARIHPEQPVTSLDEGQSNALHAALRSVLTTAVKADANSAEFPPEWLFHYRWTNKKASAVGGNAIAFVTVGSRTSAFVPDLQKLVGGGLQLADAAPRREAKGKKVKLSPGSSDNAPSRNEDEAPGPKRSRDKAAAPKACGREETRALKRGRKKVAILVEDNVQAPALKRGGIDVIEPQNERKGKAPALKHVHNNQAGQMVTVRRSRAVHVSAAASTVSSSISAARTLVVAAKPIGKGPQMRP